jgi:hypothetical protein
MNLTELFLVKYNMKDYDRTIIVRLIIMVLSL